MVYFILNIKSLLCIEVNLFHQCPHKSVLQFEMRFECSPHQRRGLIFMSVLIEYFSFIGHEIMKLKK